MSSSVNGILLAWETIADYEHYKMWFAIFSLDTDKSN